MFKLKKGDYELIFEYESVEELKEILTAAKETQEHIENNIIQFQSAEKTIQKLSSTNDTIKWRELEAKFVEAKRKSDKVSSSTYKQYATAFNKLHEFFKNKDINNLTAEDYEEFRNFLSKKHKLKNKTINNHIMYASSFLDFAVNRRLINFNPIKAIESLKEEKSEKENYTDKEIHSILSYKFEENIHNFFKIAVYTGMRLHEVHNLTDSDIKINSEGIYYFDITKSKTNSGLRQVPIHNNILDDILSIEFPLFPTKTANAVQKVMSRNLKKVITNNNKTFHSFRGTFISKAVEKYPEQISVIQEIVGHSKSEKDRLTIDTYAKGFSLKLKKGIVDSIIY